MSYLKIFIGPMFSSKTSNLLSEIDSYKNIYSNEEILVINSNLDKKRQQNSEDGKIETHDGINYKATMLNNLSEIKNTQLYYNAKVVIIDEGQFYDDIYTFIKDEIMNKYNKKKYIIAGLQAGYKLNFVGDFYKLIPLADDIIHLSSYCVYCKKNNILNKANFVYRKIPENNIFIGHKDIYDAVCRFHYLENNGL